MEYNTSRSQLIIPEYGRNVHNMVNYCMSIEDREKRNKTAQSIVDVMGNLNPHLRDVADFKHKLWDHLFILSNFTLDVDSPYPIPTPETFAEKPERVVYPVKSRRYRHYGEIVRKMISYCVKLEPGDLRDGLELSIANQMKKSYMLWNKDTVQDVVILNELRLLSEGQINLKGVELSSHAQFKGQTLAQTQRPRKQQNRNNNNKQQQRKKYKK